MKSSSFIGILASVEYFWVGDYFGKKVAVFFSDNYRYSCYCCGNDSFCFHPF